MTNIIKVNLANPEDLKRPTFEPVEPGTYRFVVTNKLKVEKAQSSDNMKIEVELTSISENIKGRKVFDVLLPGHPKMAWKFNQFIVACGITPDASGNINLDDCFNREVEAVIKQEVYEKKDGTKGLKNVVEEYVYIA